MGNLFALYLDVYFVYVYMWIVLGKTWPEESDPYFFPAQSTQVCTEAKLLCTKSRAHGLMQAGTWGLPKTRCLTSCGYQAE